MSSPLLDRHHPEHGRWVTLGLAVLALALLMAFWGVCQQQVRAAEERHTSSRGERVAMDECLHSLPGATPIRCADRIDNARGVAGRTSR